MENTNMDPKLCTGSPRLGHDGDYGKIGFSPCKAFVAHEQGKPCNVIENVTEDTPINCNCVPPKSPCQIASCPCGEFISHKVTDPCTAI